MKKRKLLSLLLAAALILTFGVPAFSAAHEASASRDSLVDDAVFKAAFDAMLSKANDLMWSTRPSETGKLVFDDQYWTEPELLYWLADCYSAGYDLKAGWADPKYTPGDRFGIYYDLVWSTSVVEKNRCKGEDVVPHALPPYTPAPPIVTLQPAGVKAPDPARTETFTFSGPALATTGSATLRLSYSSEYNNGTYAIPVSVEFADLATLDAAGVAVKVADALSSSTAFTAVGWAVSSNGSSVTLTWTYPGNRSAQDFVAFEVVDDGGTGIAIVDQTTLLAERQTIWASGSEGVLTINRPMVTNNTIWVGEYRFGGKRYTFGQGGFTGATVGDQADALFSLLTNGENSALAGFDLKHEAGTNTITFSATKAGEHPPWFIYTIRNFSTFSSWERGDKQRPLMSWAMYPRIDLPESRYWFEVHKLPHNVYAFYEPGDNDQEVMSFLIIGDGEAMLLDTGEGIGDLKKAVEELIEHENLEITIDDVFVTITHGHGDHLGSVGQFDGKKVYCHPDAVSSVERGVGSKTTGGTGYGWDVPGGQARLTLPGAKVTQTVVEGDTINVGGRILDVIVTPDHTNDSITLIDRENGIIFTGDWYYAGWGYTSSACGYIYDAEYTRVYELLGEMLEKGDVGKNVEDFWIFGQHNELMYGRQIFMDNAKAWRYTINGEGPKFAIGSARNYRFFNGGPFYGPRNMTSAQFPGNVPALHKLGGCVRCAAYFGSPAPRTAFSLSVLPVSGIEGDVEYALTVRDAVDLLTVELEFEVDGNMLAGKGAEALSGFAVVDGIAWKSLGGSIWRGTVTIGYPAGDSTGYTSVLSADIAKFVFAPRAIGSATMKLTGIRATGFVENETRYIDVAIENSEASTNIEQLVFSKYDLNKDNAVDALDLGIMLLYCGFDGDSLSWYTLVKVNDSKGKPVIASMCDVNGDGVIDMLDLLDLFIHYTK